MSTSPKPFAFVCMPFHSSFDDTYRLGIAPTAQECGFYAERVDEQIFTEDITDRIYNQIFRADVIIADMSGRNPNVFYEVGYAHGLNKTVILLTKSKEDIPFDLITRPHIIYGESISSLKTELKKKLDWAHSQITEYRPQAIQVKLVEQSAILEKTSYMVRANLELRIDMRNNTIRKSPEIAALYLYSGENLRLRQNHTSVEHAESDVDPFSIKHFLAPPARVLPPDGWIPLRLSATKTLQIGKVEDFPDSYPLEGRMLFRVSTDEGNFDFNLNIDTVADELPF